MRNRRSWGGMAAVLLCAGVVWTGLWVPRQLLEGKKAGLLSDGGNVAVHDVAVYGVGRMSAAALRERFGKLSRFDLGDSYWSSFSREPLDTELTARDAEEAAQQFLERLSAAAEAYGIPLPEGNAAYGKAATDSGDGAVARGPEETCAVFWVEEYDPSLSFWVIEKNDRSVLLDSVSGMPLCVSLRLDGEEGAKRDMDSLYAAAARAYNEGFSHVAGFEFSDPVVAAEEKYYADRGGQSAGYTLTVIASGDVSQAWVLEIRLTA